MPLQLPPPNPHPRQTTQKTRQKSPPELAGTQLFHLLLQNKILMEPQRPPPPKEKPKMMLRLPLRRPRSRKGSCTQRATLRSSIQDKKNLSRKVQDVMPFDSINGLLADEIFSGFAIPAHLVLCCKHFTCQIASKCSALSCIVLVFFVVECNVLKHP
jgi:hypothetical protein